MKNIKVLFCLLAFTIVTVNSVQGQQRSVDEQKIRKLEKEWTILLQKNDTTALKRIWTPQYVVNNANGKIATRRQILDILKGGHVFQKVERNIERITFNGAIAVVMGSETEFQPKKNEHDTVFLKLNRRFTNIWTKQGQEWRMVARQATTVSSKD